MRCLYETVARHQFSTPNEKHARSCDELSLVARLR
jgi:hypothetical protein